MAASEEWVFAVDSGSTKTNIVNIANASYTYDLLSLDPDVTSLSLPANVWITPFSKTLLAATTASEARTTLDVLGSVPKIDEYIRATSYVIPTGELKDHIINNYGQADASIIYKLPTAEEALKVIVICGTARAGKSLIIASGSTDKIYLDGVAGSDLGAIETTPAIGSSILITSFKVDTLSWDWFVKVLTGTWTALTHVDRITSTGDKRITSAIDQRVIAL
jgi:hypothetical protein